MDTSKIDFEKEYNNRFDFRKDFYIKNFKELTNITNGKNLSLLETFRCLYPAYEDNELESLKKSIFTLVVEATFCYVYEIFQSCILVCGSVTERILKYEYLKVYENLPKGTWTLGRLIYKLDWTATRIDERILELAKVIKSPRNDRAHAILEQSNPELANMGGQNRGIYIVDENKYLIYPYRGEAKEIIKNTFEILTLLYAND